MPPYNGPETERNFYFSKFVRVGSRLVVTKPDDLDTSHSKLAEVEGLIGELKNVVTKNPDDVDAGIFSVTRPNKEIEIQEDSFTLRLPKTLNARTITCDLFREKSEGYKVTSHRVSVILYKR
jgi:hypothetical protein